MSDTIKDAILSECGTYRYYLSREWDNLPAACFIMHNPSTADASVDDPTINRCMGFARAWGYGGIIVVNRFALRSPKPEALYAHADPVGPDNDDTIHAVFETVRDVGGIVVAAWGCHSGTKAWKSTLQVREAAIKRIAAQVGVSKIHAIQLGQNGPSHPLYLSGSLTPVEWWSV